jgi:hypothetical protein
MTMTREFLPFANEHDVIRIGSIEIENRLDRISMTGTVELTKDKTGLALANELQQLLKLTIKLLEAEKKLPMRITLKPATTVKNPFL